ncbi:helix-turn-helix transcriptional regulator [Stenotrophomonas rhizophila]|uniref:helix-turn-helix transcriptional regulator n=1 Tax=Stenotrophomonas rhizophila TaxID=216778 RepID=UPI001E32ACEB|nr:WYL domain-containing protein [Stenotrophomonas rhizophila]MCC7635418.1 WYL domain-containing protein [Stenotrophomonas rhizophila]MCC7664353.1 WYL domain-containing protein [Stenotrophomonas rhizophila]
MLTTSARLLSLLSLLQSRPHWAGSALAERSGVHPRTLRRDIDRLRQLGYPIQASSGVAGGYAFRAGRALPPLLLDDEEALAAAVALRTAVTGTVSGIEQTAITALVKLEQVMPPRLRKRLDALRSAILPLDQVGPVVDAGLLAALAGACRDQLQLRFDYSDRTGQPSQRLTEPQGVVHTDRRWYLVAWDTTRQDWRTFRIDRIVGAPSVGAHFSPRPGPGDGDLRQWVVQALSLGQYAEQARIILHAPLATLRNQIPASAGTLEAVDEQRCLLRCGANPLGSVVYWLMALELEFEVLGPPALRERLRDAGQRLARSLARGETKAGNPG